MHDSRQGPEQHGLHMGLRRTSSRRVLDVLREQTTIEQLWDYLDECTPTCVIMNESTKRPFDGPRGEGCSRAGHQQETLCVRGGREQRCIWYSELETSEPHAWCVFGQASGCCLGMSCSATRQLMATIWKFFDNDPRAGCASAPQMRWYIPAQPEMPRRMRRVVVTSAGQKRDRKASEHEVCAIDDESDNGEARDFVGKLETVARDSRSPEKVRPDASSTTRTCNKASFGSNQTV